MTMQASSFWTLWATSNWLCYSVSYQRLQHSLSDMLVRCQKVVGHYKHSHLAVERLQDIQHQLDLHGHKLIQPNRMLNLYTTYLIIQLNGNWLRKLSSCWSQCNVLLRSSVVWEPWYYWFWKWSGTWVSQTLWTASRASRLQKMSLESLVILQILWIGTMRIKLIFTSQMVLAIRVVPIISWLIYWPPILHFFTNISMLPMLIQQ